MEDLTKLHGEQDSGLFYDTADKILALSDQLSESIVLDNIQEQLSNKLEPLANRINYVSLFREKFAEIDPEDEIYDEEYMKTSLARVAMVISKGIEERYGVQLGADLDYALPDEYLTDMETLYEFLFIRHYENLKTFFKYELNKNKQRYINAYENDLENETAGKDIFVQLSKKKFKNKEDIIIIHFLNDILKDIQTSVVSAYDLFTEIADLDKFEEYNNRMLELLINYGNKIVLNNDALTALKYMEPMNDPEVFSEVRNSILIDYLEGCEIDEKA